MLSGGRGLPRPHAGHSAASSGELAGDRHATAEGGSWGGMQPTAGGRSAFPISAQNTCKSLKQPRTATREFQRVSQPSMRTAIARRGKELGVLPELSQLTNVTYVCSSAYRISPRRLASAPADKRYQSCTRAAFPSATAVLWTTANARSASSIATCRGHHAVVHECSRSCRGVSLVAHHILDSPGRSMQVLRSSAVLHKRNADVLVAPS